jgi:hypothetical protein
MPFREPAFRVSLAVSGVVFLALLVILPLTSRDAKRGKIRRFAEQMAARAKKIPLV